MVVERRTQFGRPSLALTKRERAAVAVENVGRLKFATICPRGRWGGRAELELDRTGAGVGGVRLRNREDEVHEVFCDTPKVEVGVGPRLALTKESGSCGVGSGGRTVETVMRLAEEESGRSGRVWT